SYYLTKLLVVVLSFSTFPVLSVNAQVQTDINSILDSIQAVNPSLKMYDAEIRSLDEAAKGAKSWMAPELSSGFFMTPYAPRYWKYNSGVPGMG
ncbi:hypothetical protein ABTM94_19080, partial [Acinetobacter baumannii]